MIKKILTLLFLFVITTTLLCACGKSNNNEDLTNSETNNKTENIEKTDENIKNANNSKLINGVEGFNDYIDNLENDNASITAYTLSEKVAVNESREKVKDVLRNDPGLNAIDELQKANEIIARNK